MQSIIAVVAILAYGAVFGVAMTGAPARRTLLMIVPALALAAPFFMHDAPFLLRLGVTGGVTMTFLRLLDLARDRRAIPALRRLMHATLIVELRRTRRVPPRLNRSALAQLLVMLALGPLAIFAIWHVPPVSLASHLLRGALGIVVTYAVAGLFSAYAMLQWNALGFDIPVMHEHPALARTVAEFWSERWNQVIGRWLRTHLFMPLARRRMPRLGLIAAFAGSTALHIYLAWAVLDAAAAGMWAIFFALQVPILLAERRLGVASWPAWRARVWTFGALGAASPFFVQPLLRVIDASH